MDVKPRKSKHPGWACCESSTADFLSWVERNRIAAAQGRELVRNLRAAAEAAREQSITHLIAHSQEAQDWWSPGRSLERALDAHAIRLFGLANAHAQSLQMGYGQLERVIAAHPWRFDGPE